MDVCACVLAYASKASIYVTIAPFPCCRRLLNQLSNILLCALTAHTHAHTHTHTFAYAFMLLMLAT